jgi:hypothetical protein
MFKGRSLADPWVLDTYPQISKLPFKNSTNGPPITWSNLQIHMLSLMNKRRILHSPQIRLGCYENLEVTLYRESNHNVVTLMDKGGLHIN